MNPNLPAVRIQVLHRRETLDVRAQDRIVQADIFAEAWTFATVEQRRKVLEFIEQVDYLAVKEWVAEIMIGTLDRCTIKVLRDLARYHRISNYSRMSKAKLVDELNKRGN